jgi:hypothetical protein
VFHRVHPFILLSPKNPRNPWLRGNVVFFECMVSVGVCR